MNEEDTAVYGLGLGSDEEEELQRPPISPMVSTASSVPSKVSDASRALEGSVVSLTLVQSPILLSSLVSGK